LFTPIFLWKRVRFILEELQGIIIRGPFKARLSYNIQAPFY